MTAEIRKVDATVMGMNAAFEAATGAATRLTVAQRSLATSASAINQSLNVRSDFGYAARAADIAAYGAELDRLRAKFNPLFAAGREYRATLDEINMAAKVGAISEMERAAAIDRTKAAFAAQVPVLRGAANASALNAGQMQNITFQLNDMAVMMASGQNPFVMIMQQGMQIAQVFGPGVGVAGALKATGGALVSFLTNPLTLAIGGLALAAGAVDMVFNAIAGGSKSAEDSLQRQRTLVDAITDAYGKTASEVDRLVKTQGKMLITSASRELWGSRSATTQASNELLAKSMSGDFRWEKFWSDASDGLKRDWEVFVEQLKDGSADVIAFRENLDQVWRNFGTKGNRDLISTLMDMTQGLADAEEQSRRLAAALAVADGSATDLQRSLVGLKPIAEALAEINAQFDVDMMAIGARSPSQKAAVAAERERLSMMGEIVSKEEQDLRIANAAARARAEAEYELSEAYRSRMASMQDGIDSARLELDLVGRGVSEAARLKTEYTLLTEAKRAAIESGTVVSEGEIAGIRAAAAETGRLNLALAEADTMRGIQFDREQMRRSPIEQDVATALRDLYGDDWQGHADDAIAKQIRMNGLLERARDSITDVGGQAFDAFGEFVSGAKSAEEAIKDLIQQLLLAEARSLFLRALNPSADAGPISAILAGLTGGGAPVLSGSAGIFFAKGGVSNKPAIFGESGPEAAVPLPDGRSIPVSLDLKGLPGRSDEGGRPSVNITVVGPKSDAEIVNLVRTGVRQGLGEYDKGLPERVRKISEAPRRRGGR